MEIACYKPGVTSQADGLFASTSMSARKEVVYAKHFHPSSLSVSLRPFCVPRDMTTLYKWAKKLNRAEDSVAVSYLYTSYSDFARSFMALINNRIPVCQVDICAADKDELCETYPSSPGTYIIRLLMNTNKKIVRPLHLKALQTCMEYFFSFPHIKQIIAEPEDDNKLCNDLLQKVGFQFEDQVYHQYTVCNLFVCTRETFIRQH
jgi:RimJ/RimL family protein N-acetyltransferase